MLFQEKKSFWHQVWFDNPESLQWKYKLVKQYKLRGAGVWNSNCLDSSNSTSAIRMRLKFWGQLKELSETDYWLTALDEFLNLLPYFFPIFSYI